MGATSLGVAVIGVGMAGRAHAAGYRDAATLYGEGLPPIRLVAVADVNAEFAQDAARRFGFGRADTTWQAIAAAPDIDVVSVVVSNALHREVVEGLLAAGKHVLCEKPMAPSVADAEAMVAAAESSGLQAGVGFTVRRAPAVAAIREQLDLGHLGEPVHLDLHYWCDYGCDPNAPMSWRYRGGPGSGALSDIGSHLLDLAEYLGGPLARVDGAMLRTIIEERPLPLGVAMGHAATAVSDERAAVENEDTVSIVGTFASGASVTLTASRVAFGHPNALGLELFTSTGGATFDLDRLGEFGFLDQAVPGPTNGYRRVLAGPAHPYLARGLPMDFPGVGVGQNDLFRFQARAFLEQVAGLDRLPPAPSFADGLRNVRLIDAVVRSAASSTAVPVEQPASVPEAAGRAG